MRLRVLSGALLLVLGMLAPAWPQTSSTPPLGPDLPQGGKPGAVPDNPQAMVPDTRPLSGVEQLTLGGLPAKHGTMDTQFSVAQTFDSNPAVQAGSNYQAVTVLSGKFDASSGGADETRLSYLGTGIVYPKNTQYNTQYHAVYLGQSFQLRRWSVLFSDQATYSPESVFGYGLGGFGGFGITGGGLNPSYVPNQSILTGLSTRLDNVVAGEVRYRTSPHGSISFSGSYGLLHFTDVGGVDNDQITTTAGYDQQLTRRDTLGVSYSHTFFRYSAGRSFEGHTARLSYARRVTGRLSLRLSGGPQVYTFDTLPGTPTGQNVTYSADGGLLYQRGKTGLNISALRGATGGGGVFEGAETYQAVVYVSRAIGQSWQSYVSGGYAHNKWISGVAMLNTVYATTGLRRSLGRNAGIYFNYNALRQTGTAACIGSTVCDSGPVRHVIGMGLDFSLTRKPL